MFKFKRPVKCRNPPGRCPYGSSCNYAHSEKEFIEAKKRVIYTKSSAYTKPCRNGPMCQDQHTTCMYIHNNVITGGVITKESLLGSFSKVSHKMSGLAKVSSRLSLVNTFNNCLLLVNISLGQEGGGSKDSGASTVIILILESSGTCGESQDAGGAEEGGEGGGGG